MQQTSEFRERIVDAALELAAQRNWEGVRLRHIAQRLDIRLNDIREHFSEKEAIVDAWFDRADQAMLAAAAAQEPATASAGARIEILLMAWLGALAPYRAVTRQMIAGKMEPGHLHVQIPGLLRVSRTVQWLREAAGREATFARRALEETGLTAVYLATFVFWMGDDSPDGERTRGFLRRRLRQAGCIGRLFGCGQRKLRP